MPDYRFLCVFLLNDRVVYYNGMIGTLTNYIYYYTNTRLYSCMSLLAPEATGAPVDKKIARVNLSFRASSEVVNQCMCRPHINQPFRPENKLNVRFEQLLVFHLVFKLKWTNVSIVFIIYIKIYIF